MAIRRKQIHSPRPPSEYNPTRAAQDARRIAYGYTLKKEPLDVAGLASMIGLRIQRRPLPDDISGYLKREGNEWVIGVNALHHPNRQRFTIAHELGHYFLHRDKGAFLDRAIFRDSSSNPDEWDANKFASLLLMPGESFGRYLAQGIPLRDIAKRFGVSEVAATYRHKNLEDERIPI